MQKSAISIGFTFPASLDHLKGSSLKQKDTAAVKQDDPARSAGSPKAEGGGQKAEG